MHNKKFNIILLFFIALLFMTGCWDKVEIEKRAFVALMGIDKFESASGNKAPKISSEGDDHIQQNRYTITYAYPNTGKIAGKGDGEPKFIYMSTGEDPFSVREDLGTRLGKNLFLRHMKAVVIGEGLAKDEQLLRELLDRIDRSPEIGRRVNLLITRGVAKDVLNVSTKDESVLGLFIRDLMERHLKPSKVPNADLNYMLRSLDESKTAIIPCITSSKNEFKVAGSGVIKDLRLVGWLGEMETNDLMYMMDKVRVGVLNVEVDGLIIPLSITGSKTKKKVFEKDGEIIVQFDIKAESDLKRHLFKRAGETDENSYYQKIQRMASQKMEKQIAATYKKIQKEFGADLLQVGEYLRKYEPDLWEKIKGDWDNIYPTTDIRVKVDMKVRRSGVII